MENYKDKEIVERLVSEIEWLLYGGWKICDEISEENFQFLKTIDLKETIIIDYERQQINDYYFISYLECIDSKIYQVKQIIMCKKIKEGE